RRFHYFLLRFLLDFLCCFLDGLELVEGEVEVAAAAAGFSATTSASLILETSFFVVDLSAIASISSVSSRSAIDCWIKATSPPTNQYKLRAEGRLTVNKKIMP